MTGYLFDTSVVSLLAPNKPSIPSHLAEWIVANAEDLFVPTIAVAEIEIGIAKLERAGGIARARRLSDWLERLITNFGTRVLPLDTKAARRAGRISEASTAIGRNPGFADIAIGGIADARGLTVLTRNVRHFEALGVACADPFAGAPF